MRSGTRELLSKVLRHATNITADPKRWIDVGEMIVLSDEVQDFAAALQPDGRTLVNNWTCLLAEMLVKLAGLGPWGNELERERALCLINQLVCFVQVDLSEALDRTTRPLSADRD